MKTSNSKSFIPTRLQLVAVLILSGFCANASAIAKQTISYTHTRAKDAIHWMVWNENTMETISNGERPMLFSISHELNDLTRSMAAESFHNEEVAKMINEHFYPVVVDSHENPILTGYFHSVLQGTKQITGFPLTVFTTKDLHWIDGGGYFPPSDDWGGQGFPNLLKGVIEKWETTREQTIQKAANKQDSLGSLLGSSSKPSGSFDASRMGEYVSNLEGVYDMEFGGFIVGPKSPDFAKLGLLEEITDNAAEEAERAQSMKSATLQAILTSSIHDFVGGGFFASSTDDLWLIPQFIKSVTDQCKAIQYFTDYSENEDLILEVAQCIVNDFKMDSGFYSDHILLTSDSDPTFESGIKGDAYIWKFETFSNLFSDSELAAFIDNFDVSEEGNIPADQDPEGGFAGKNLLRLKHSSLKQTPTLLSALNKLAEYRKKNSTVLSEQTMDVASNARVVTALTIAGKKKGDLFIEEAEALVKLIWGTFYDENSNRLMTPSILDDQKVDSECSSLEYALLEQGFLSLYEATGNTDYLSNAKLLQDAIDTRFTDDTGLCFVSPKDHPFIPLSTYAIWEEDDVSAVAVCIQNLRKLVALDGGDQYEGNLSNVLSHIPEAVEQAPEHFSFTLTVLSAE